MMNPLNCLTFAFQRASRSLVRGFEGEVKSLGLTAPQFTMLTLLANFGSQTMTELSEKSGTERTTLTRNIQVMRQRGWLQEVETKDQRITALALSNDGRDLYHRALPVWRAWQAKLLKQFGTEFAEALLTRAQDL